MMVQEWRKDPVCGMWVDPETAAATTRYGSETYHFCAKGCRDSFEDEPELYLSRAVEAQCRAADEVPRGEGGGSKEPGGDGRPGPHHEGRFEKSDEMDEMDELPGVVTAPAPECPHCGTATDARREPRASVIEGLDLDELQTLTRNEWRARLGPNGFHRRHSEWLIRALALLVVSPRSPVLRAQIEEELSMEVAELRAEGKGRAVAQVELRLLVLAMRKVLVTAAGLSHEEAIRITEPAQDLLERLLDRPDEAILEG